jgi:hypothetical protein
LFAAGIFSPAIISDRERDLGKGLCGKTSWEQEQGSKTDSSSDAHKLIQISISVPKA